MVTADTPGLSAGSKAHEESSKQSPNPMCDSGTRLVVCWIKTMKAETGVEALPLNPHTSAKGS